MNDPARAPAEPGVGTGRVLVVDNDPALCRLLEMAFARADLQVVAASRAEEAEAVLAAGGVQAVLLDLNLGGGASGASVLRGREGEAALPPCWLVTGTPDDPRVAEAEGHPALRGVIAKPFSVLELVDEVAAALASQDSDVGREDEAEA
jgi:DNA-binding NtrC family response regulator